MTIRHNIIATCPTPCFGNIKEAQKYFTLVNTHRLSTEHVTLEQRGKVLRWNVTIRLEDKYVDHSTIKTHQIKQLFRNTYSSVIVYDVYKVMTVQQTRWILSCTPQPLNISPTAVNIYNRMRSMPNKREGKRLNISDVNSVESEKAVSPLGSHKKGKDSKLHKNEEVLKLSDLTIVTSELDRIRFVDVDTSCRPRFILLGKRNVTAQLTGKRRLCKTLLNSLINILPCSIINCRRLIREERQRQVQKKATVPVVRMQYSEVPGPSTSDQSLQDSSYYGTLISKSKLRDVNVFRAASQFLALAQVNGELSNTPGNPIELNRRPTIDYTSVSRLQLMYRLRCAGLPTDSSLYQLFQQFCNDIGISEVQTLLLDEFENLKRIDVDYV